MLHNEELRVLHSAPDILKVIKPKRIRYDAQPAPTEREDLHVKF